MVTLSLCMIVKNEEAFLEKCLQSVQGLVDEIIIVDTGSIDKTKEIARRFTSKVYDFKWCDDFAAARNESLKYATGDWILVLDADEVIAREDFLKIRELIEQDINQSTDSAYELPQLHYTNKYLTHPDFVAEQSDLFKGFYVTFVLRLFKRLEVVKFDYCVHETVIPSLLKNNFTFSKTVIPIHHFHELKGDDFLDAKQKKYFDLAFKNIEKYPLYGKNYFDLSIYYSATNLDSSKALFYAKRAYELEPDNISYILNYSYKLRNNKLYVEAIDFLEGISKKINNFMVLKELGYLYFQIKDFSKALEYYTLARALNNEDESIEQAIFLINKVLSEKS